MNDRQRTKRLETKNEVATKRARRAVDRAGEGDLVAHAQGVWHVRVDWHGAHRDGRFNQGKWQADATVDTQRRVHKVPRDGQGVERHPTQVH